ncbi:MAG: hypothetical protein ABEI13_00775 [Candidatus Paceibacteria bacterium]
MLCASETIRIYLPIKLLIICYYTFNATYLFRRHAFASASFSIPTIAVLSIAITANKFPSIFSFGGYLSRDVYTRRTTAIASGAIVIALSIHFLVALILTNEHKITNLKISLSDLKIIEKLKWPFTITGGVLLYLTSPQNLFFYVSYASWKSGPLLDVPGLKLLGIILLSVVLGWTIIKEGYFGWSLLYNPVFIAALFFLFYFQFLRGERSTSLSAIYTLGVLYFMFMNKSLAKKLYTSLLYGLLLFIFMESIAVLRTTVSAGMGYEKLYSYIVQFRVSNISLIPQMYWHMLHVIDLYHSGVWLGGESFLNIVPQSVPGFVAEALGYNRPESGAWKLAEYRNHAGGMFSVALAYWNLGIFGVVLFSAINASCLSIIDNVTVKESKIYLPAFIALSGLAFVAMGYGFLTLIRAYQVIFLVVSIIFIVKHA